MLRLFHIAKIPQPGVLKVSWVGIFIFLCSLPLSSQNLIPNPSFESFNDYTNYDLVYPWQSSRWLLDWHFNTRDRGVGSLSDSIRKANPFENLFYRPYHGQSYMRVRLLNNKFNGSLGKATAQAELNDSLRKGCYYRFSMYVLPEAVYPIEPDPMDPYSRTANYASAKSFGAYFSKDPILDTVSPPGHAFDSANIKPQIRLPQDHYITDTTNYTRESGTFKAQGGEKYITLGYFGWLDTMEVYKFREQQVYDTSETWIVFFCVDSLNLYQIPPTDTLLTSSRDTSMCPGDSLQLFTHAREALSINWDNGSTDSLRTITQPGTYWVDAYYPCGDVLSDTIVVTANDVLPSIAIKDTTICEGETVRYTLPPGPAYQLDGNAIGNSFSLSDDGVHVIKAVTTCEGDSFTFNLSYKPVKELPRISISDTALCEGDEMRVKLPGGFSYTLNDRMLNDSLLVVNERNQYTLEADNSCEKRSYNFTVNDEGCALQLYIPNAFTPDGDGLNDFFTLSVSEYQSFHIAIFNRWGEMVFESRNPEDRWDGTVDGQKVTGSYTYVVKVDDGKRRHTRHGVVTVLR